MLFAEISDTVWLAIIGIVAMVVKDVLDAWRARRAAAAVVKAVVDKADEAAVQRDVDMTAIRNDTVKQTQHLVSGLEKVAASVEEVQATVTK